MSNTTLTDLTGTRLGEYLVTAPLGTGGMGVVYEGVQPIIGKKVAVKVLLPQLMADQTLVERFLAEARAVNAIRHRGIVDIFGFGELPGGALYFVMELLEGVPFDALLKREGALEPSRVLGYLEEILDALDAVHAVGITHRDIKPSNIFLVMPQRGRPYVKLLDFGIAKLGRTLQGSTGEVTRVNMVLGTPNYMAPEQVRAEAVGPATDLYSLGCVLFELLTGERPFAGGNAMDTMMMHVQDPPRRPSSVRRGVPPELDALVAWMLEKDPRARPPSAHALLEHVEKLRTGAATQPVPWPPWPPRPAQSPAPELEEPTPQTTQMLRPLKGGAEQTRVRPRQSSAAAIDEIPTQVRQAPARENEARIPTLVHPEPAQGEARPQVPAALRAELPRAAPSPAAVRAEAPLRKEAPRAAQAPAEPLRTEPAAAVRAELSRAAPAQPMLTEPARAAAAQPILTEPSRAAAAPPMLTEPARAAAAQPMLTEPARAAPLRGELPRAAPAQPMSTEPSRAAAAQPILTEPSRAAAAQPILTEPARAASLRGELPRAAPAQPMSTEPARAVPIRAASILTEPARAAPAQALRGEPVAAIRTELSRAAQGPAEPELSRSAAARGEAASAIRTTELSGATAAPTEPPRAEAPRAPSPRAISTDRWRVAPSPAAQDPAPDWEPTTAPVDARSALAELAQEPLPVESQAPLPVVSVLSEPPLELLDAARPVTLNGKLEVLEFVAQPELELGGGGAGPNLELPRLEALTLPGGRPPSRPSAPPLGVPLGASAFADEGPIPAPLTTPAGPRAQARGGTPPAPLAADGPTPAPSLLPEPEAAPSSAVPVAGVLLGMALAAAVMAYGYSRWADAQSAEEAPAKPAQVQADAEKRQAPAPHAVAVAPQPGPFATPVLAADAGSVPPRAFKSAKPRPAELAHKLESLRMRLETKESKGPPLPALHLLLDEAERELLGSQSDEALSRAAKSLGLLQRALDAK